MPFKVYHSFAVAYARAWLPALYLRCLFLSLQPFRLFNLPFSRKWPTALLCVDQAIKW